MCCIRGRHSVQWASSVLESCPWAMLPPCLSCRWRQSLALAHWPPWTVGMPDKQPNHTCWALLAQLTTQVASPGPHPPNSTPGVPWVVMPPFVVALACVGLCHLSLAAASVSWFAPSFKHFLKFLSRTMWMYVLSMYFIILVGFVRKEQTAACVQSVSLET